MGEDAFLLARQENLETIHRHSVVAERHGLMGELGRELREQVTVPHHVTAPRVARGPSPAGLNAPTRRSGVDLSARFWRVPVGTPRYPPKGWSWSLLTPPRPRTSCPVPPP